MAIREGEVQEFTLEQLKHLVSERALRGETILLNVGPQHPSTHGVLRLLVELDSETIVSVVPDIGYLHTGIEKHCESKTYTKIIPLTDRIDYLSPMSNNLAYVMAVEKLLGVEVPLRASSPWARSRLPWGPPGPLPPQRPLLEAGGCGEGSRDDS